MKIAFVVSEFNYDITEMMLSMAKEHAKFLGAAVSETIHVPGVYDMPLAVKHLMMKTEVNAVVAIGAVMEGETSHDELIAAQTARKLTDLSVEFNKPVGLGITGPGMTRLQAQERIPNARQAVESVVKMLKNLGMA